MQGRIDIRAGDLAAIRRASATLRTNARDVLRCLQVLDIYGMNVKIAASGLPQFMDFADRMRSNLASGNGEVRSLDETLELLDQGLGKMERNDALLSGECAKVMPQVPDKLMRDAEALETHQAGLVRLTRAINALATAVRSELGVALGAIRLATGCANGWNM